MAWLTIRVVTRLFLLLGLASPLPAQQPLAPQAKPATAYIRWLEQRSMLYQARAQATKISGSGVQWRRPYAEPQPEAVIQRASVWFLDYPGSVIPNPGQSVIATWANPDRWDTFEQLGIQLLHTGPVKLSGGIRGKNHTPTIDGWFDRISLDIDPQLGTEAEYLRLVRVARAHDGWIAGDLVPLHTGTGYDFRLAQLAYKDYPGMYTMVSIDEQDWGLLPAVKQPWGSTLVSKQVATKLTEKGYIPGIINSNDAAPEAREWSGWSASGPIVGVDGETRRWVFLHYFKPGQPTLDWLDPSAAAPRAIYGDLTKTVHSLGARVMRLDAIPFLALETEPGQAPLTLHYQHPTSIIRTQELAQLTRKLGGWTFQELNVPLVELKQFTHYGPDLSYDFFTRTQCVHALLMRDATLLRQAYGFLLDAGVPLNTLVHDLQNHDEITYQLVELDYRGDDTFFIKGLEILGRQLKERILRQMRTKVAGKAAPYNRLYRPTQDGVATTFAGFIAAALDIRNPTNATPEQIAKIRRGHLLLAHANAMQPGVFALSSWDLVGALPLPVESVKDRVEDGDYRWINRGGVDLLGKHPEAKVSAFGLPKAKALYGSLTSQLQRPDSFARQLQPMLAARKEYRLPEGRLIAVPKVGPIGACVLVMQVPGSRLAVTALNFSEEPTEVVLDLSELPKIEAAKLVGQPVIDIVAGKPRGKVAENAEMPIKIPGWQGVTLVVP